METTTRIRRTDRHVYYSPPAYSRDPVIRVPGWLVELIGSAAAMAAGLLFFCLLVAVA